MNSNPPPESDVLRRRQTVSRIACLTAFPMVAVCGWCIHVYVLPLPIESLSAGVVRFAYFLLWLGALLCLLGTAFFGFQSRPWQIVVYVLLGLCLGSYGGLMFAGVLGLFVGAFSGLVVGPITFLIRQRINNRRLTEAGQGS